MSCEISAAADALTVRREVHVTASPERLWEAIAAPGALTDWLAEEADIELVPGGTGRFVDDEGVERLAVVDAVVTGRHLTFRWWPADGDGEASRVTLTVTGDGHGARLVVAEQPLAPVGGASAQASVRASVRVTAGRAAGWEARLDRLAVALAGTLALVG